MIIMDSKYAKFILYEEYLSVVVFATIPASTII